MDLKINITPEDIERQVVDSIVKSGIGKRIETTLFAALNGYQFGRAVDEAVLDAVRTIVRDEVLNSEAMKERIRAAMVEKITDSHLQKLLDIALKIDRD